MDLEKKIKILEEENRKLKKQVSEEKTSHEKNLPLEGADEDEITNKAKDMGSLEYNILTLAKDIVDKGDVKNITSDTSEAKNIAIFYRNLNNSPVANPSEEFKEPIKRIYEEISNQFYKIGKAFQYLYHSLMSYMDAVDPEKNENAEVEFQKKKGLYQELTAEVQTFIFDFIGYKQAYQNLIIFVVTGTDKKYVSKFYEKFKNLLDKRALVQETYCKILLTLSKINESIIGSDAFAYANNDFCPKTYPNIENLKRDFETKKGGLLSNLVSKVKKAVTSVKDFIDKNKWYSGKVVSFITSIVNFANLHYTAFVLTIQAPLTTLWTVAWKGGFSLTGYNLILLLGIYGCQVLGDSAVLGDLVSTIGTLMISLPNIAKFSNYFYSAFSTFASTTVAQLGPYIVSSGLKQLFYGIFVNICTIIENVLFTGETKIKNVIESLTQGFSGNTKEQITSYISKVKDSKSASQYLEITKDFLAQIGTEAITSIGEFMLSIIRSPIESVYDGFVNTIETIRNMFSLGSVEEIKDKALVSGETTKLLEKLGKDIYRISTTVISSSAGAACSIAVRTSKYILSNIWENVSDKLSSCVSLGYVWTLLMTIWNFISYFKYLIGAFLGAAETFVIESGSNIVKISASGITFTSNQLLNFIKSGDKDKMDNLLISLKERNDQIVINLNR